MTALSSERLAPYHLNGIAPQEARALGVSKNVERRISTASRVVEAAAAVYPEQAAAVAQVYDFEMQITRYCAARSIPVGEGIVNPLIWHLIQTKMLRDRRFRPDGNYYADIRRTAAEEIASDPQAEVNAITREMERAALLRHPAAGDYQGHLSSEQFYHKYGVDLTHGKPRAGLFVPFQPGIMGFDVHAVEVNEGVYGLLSHLVRNRSYSHLFIESSELAEQGRGRRFFETPIFSESYDGHLAGMAHPVESDLLHGIQFDNPELLAAFTVGGLMELEAARTVPTINHTIHSQIRGLPIDQRMQLV
jgi:hypothetical protein